MAENLFEPAAERVGHADARRVGAPQRRRCSDPRNSVAGSSCSTRRALRGWLSSSAIGRDRARVDAGPRRQRHACAASARRRTPYTSGLPPSRGLRRRSRRRRRRAPCGRATTCSASFSAVSALSRVNSGPPKRPGLLAGDDRRPCCRSASRRAASRARGGRSVAAPAERDDVGDLGAAAVVRLGPRDRVGPRASVGRIAGKKRRDRSKVVRVVGGEPADPRKPPDIDRNAHGSRPVLGLTGVEVSAELTCTRTPTVSKRSRGLSSTRTRYSIDATALRRRPARVGCVNFVLP